VGLVAVFIAARPLAAYLNHGKDPERDQKLLTSASEVRSEARERPTDQVDAFLCAGMRALAWAVLLVVSLGSFIGAAMLRKLETALDPALTGLMIVTVCVVLFASMSMTLQVGRATIVRVFGEHGFPPSEPLSGRRTRDRKKRGQRAARGWRAPNPLIRWLCTPSHLDVLPALYWTLMMAPLLIADIRGAG
jgi:hypothetical protein